VSWVQKWPRADFIRFTTFGNADALLITSLAAHKEILQAKCYSFVKPPFFKRLVADIVGLGLVFSEGEDHKNQRKAFRGQYMTYTQLSRLVDAGGTVLTEFCRHVRPRQPQKLHPAVSQQSGRAV
jgi:cytochrome P450